MLATFAGERDGDEYGSAVAGATFGAGKFLIVGAPKAGPDRHGRVYVYTSLTKKPAFTFDACSLRFSAGSSV